VTSSGDIRTGHEKILSWCLNNAKQYFITPHQINMYVALIPDWVYVSAVTVEYFGLLVFTVQNAMPCGLWSRADVYDYEMFDHDYRY